MAEAPYKYSKLHATKPSIRLITLLPRSHRSDGEIALALQPFALMAVSGQYTALSYMWGTDDPSHRVWINDQPFFLRRNIWLFLDHCIDPKMEFRGPEKVWIDSICIDQSNIAERNAQVTMMADIYKLAEDVVIWLDSASQQTALASTVRDTWLSSIEPSESLVDVEDAVSKEEFVYALYNVLLEPSQEIIHECLQIVHHGYWGRMWIVQENFVNPNTTIILGDLKLPKKRVSEIWLVVRSSIVESGRLTICGEACGQPFCIPFERVWYSNKLLECYKPDVEVNFLGNLLSRWKSQICLHPRDRIYGLLGMCNSPMNLRVDYNSSIEEVAMVVERAMASDLQVLRSSAIPYEPLIDSELAQNQPWMWPRWVSEALDLDQDTVQSVFGSTCWDLDSITASDWGAPHQKFLNSWQFWSKPRDVAD